MTRILAHLLAGGSIVAMTTAALAQDLPQADDSYFKAAQAELQAQLAVQPNTGKAKNVILFVGDGMSIATLTAAAIRAVSNARFQSVRYCAIAHPTNANSPIAIAAFSNKVIPFLASLTGLSVSADATKCRNADRSRHRSPRGGRRDLHSSAPG
jgi:hypothetical protein